MLDAVKRESDRGCALILAANLENRLGDVLRSACIRLSKAEFTAIFEGNGPASTLSSRIRLTHALGLIAKEEQHDLDAIRRIRNDFAHNENELDFADTSISSRCDSLLLFRDLVITRTEIDFTRYTGRAKFQTVGISLYLTLSERVREASLARRLPPTFIPIATKEG